MMTQALNLCFLVGKSTQAATLAVSGQIRLPPSLPRLP